MVLCRSGSFGLENARYPFGLSLSKPGLVRWFGRCACVECGGRVVAPAGDSLFFASPKKSKQKKGDPQSATPSLCEGANLRRGGGGGGGGGGPVAPARPAAHHPAAAPSQAQPAGEGQPNIQTSTRAFASLGRVCAARGVCAREMGPSAAQRSNGPCGCPIPGFPSVRAEKRRAGGVCVCRRTHALRALTHRSCSSGAPKARSEFCGGTLCPSITGCP